MFPPYENQFHHLGSWVPGFDEYGLPVGSEAPDLPAQSIPALDEIGIGATPFTEYAYDIDSAYAGAIPSYGSTIEDEQPTDPTEMSPVDPVDPAAAASCEHAICHWRDETSGTQCDIPLDCGGVPGHFKKHHNITKMNENELVVCCWGNCFFRGLRKNFVRHIRERHLGHSRDKGHST